MIKNLNLTPKLSQQAEKIYFNQKLVRNYWKTQLFTPKLLQTSRKNICVQNAKKLVFT